MDVIEKKKTGQSWKLQLVWRQTSWLFTNVSEEWNLGITLYIATNVLILKSLIEPPAILVTLLHSPSVEMFHLMQQLLQFFQD